MKRFFAILTLAFALTLGADDASAQAQASHDVNLRVATIDAIAVSQAPIELAITEASGDAEKLGLVSVTADSRLAVLTNGANRKLSVQVDEALPEGIRLSASTDYLGYRLGATLTESAQTVLTGITRVRESHVFTYTLEADVEAGAFTGSRTVTYTLTAN
jgi:hypothetical protein